MCFLPFNLLDNSNKNRSENIFYLIYLKTKCLLLLLNSTSLHLSLPYHSEKTALSFTVLEINFFHRTKSLFFSSASEQGISFTVNNSITVCWIRYFLLGLMDKKDQELLIIWKQHFTDLGNVFASDYCNSQFLPTDLVQFKLPQQDDFTSLCKLDYTF